MSATTAERLQKENNSSGDPLPQQKAASDAQFALSASARNQGSTSLRQLVRLQLKMRFLSSIRIVRVSLALAVALWMAGAGCMFGCENMVSAATSSDVVAHENTSTIVATGEACASMQSHHCCPKRGAHSAPQASAKTHSHETASLVPALAGIPGPMMDCPLAVNAAAALAKAGSDQSNAASVSVSGRTFLSDSPAQASAFVRPLRLPNRGHTHLRLCVFLI
jgi:hypothetical protein